MRYNFHSRWPRPSFPLIGLRSLLILFNIIFVLYPISCVLITSVLSDEGPSLATFINLIDLAILPSLLWNTILLAMIVALLSILVGFSSAFFLAETSLSIKSIFQAILLIPLISPSLIWGLSTIQLFGRAGLITNGLLGLRTNAIYGLPGLIISQTLSAAPLAYMIFASMLENMNPTLEEAASSLGASPRTIFSTITVPLLRPGFAQSFLVGFIYSVADIGAPAILGGDYGVLSKAIYLRIIGMYDLQGGAALAVGLLIVALGAFLLQDIWIGNRSYITISGHMPIRRNQIRNWPIYTWGAILFSLWATTIILSFVAILTGGFVALWGVNYRPSLQSWRYVAEVIGFDPFVNSLELSLVAAVATTVLALLMAEVFSRASFAANKVIEFGSMLSYAVPGTIIGIGYILAFNQLPLPLTGTALIIIIAFITRNLPPSTRTVMASLAQIDPVLEEAAMQLGGSKLHILRYIIGPLVLPSLISILLYSFVRSMTALSSVIFLVSPRWKLATITIMNEVNQGRIGVADLYSTIVTVTAIVVALLIYRISGRVKSFTDG